jgi:plasmid stability protein
MVVAVGLILGPFYRRLPKARKRDWNAGVSRLFQSNMQTIVQPSRRIGGSMGVLEVGELEGYVLNALKARARNRGVSLEDEVRETLIASVDRQRDDYIKRLEALRSAAKSAFGAAERGEAGRP